MWGNTAPIASQIYQSGGTPTVSYSDIQGGWSGTGNIDSDPLFVRNPSPGGETTWGTPDDDYGDLRLQAASPCIDAASNAAVPAGITTDLAGNPRFIDVPGLRDPGAIVDMGAYEYQYPPFVAVGGTFLAGAAQPTVKVSFNGGVSAASLSASDLMLVNLTTGQAIDCGSAATASYDPTTLGASWSFTSPLPDGNYRATLASGSLEDTAGNALAVDFRFDFFALGGDANHDRAVDISDLGILATNWQGSGKTFAQGDFNYDVMVDVTDLGILATNWQKTFPAPASPTGAAVQVANSPIAIPSSTPTPRPARPSLASDVIG